MLTESKMVTYNQPSILNQSLIMSVPLASSILATWALNTFAPTFIGATVPEEVIAAVYVLGGWAAGKWGT